MKLFCRSSFQSLSRALILGTMCGLLASHSFAKEATPPSVGDKAPDFELNSLAGAKVSLAEFAKKGPVVVVVLRGYPGYQCPACTAQVGQFVGQAKKLAAAKATVVFIYPGAADDLGKHAAEFLKGSTLPDNLQLVLDPDFKFTTAYHLRWDAQNETAYPATLVIDSKQKILLAQISKTHGDRTGVDAVLKALTQAKP